MRQCSYRMTVTPTLKTTPPPRKLRCALKCCYGSFTLHGTRNGNGTGTGAGNDGFITLTVYTTQGQGTIVSIVVVPVPVPVPCSVIGHYEKWFTYVESAVTGGSRVLRQSHICTAWLAPRRTWCLAACGNGDPLRAAGPPPWTCPLHPTTHIPFRFHIFLGSYGDNTMLHSSYNISFAYFRPFVQSGNSARNKTHLFKNEKVTFKWIVSKSIT